MKEMTRKEFLKLTGFIAFSNYTQSNPKNINQKLDEILQPYLK